MVLPPRLRELVRFEEQRLSTPIEWGPSAHLASDAVHVHLASAPSLDTDASPPEDPSVHVQGTDGPVLVATVS